MADINYNALPEKLTPSVSADKVLILDSEDWDKVKQQSATLFQWPQGNPWTDGTNWTNGADWLDVTWRGAYAWGTTYAINDAVSYNGSSYICILSSTWNLPTNTTYWNVMASKGADWAWSGDVVWPASSTDNAIVRYDGTTGKLIQNSGATIDDSGNITATNLSGTNTGDETTASIKTKLGITTLSGNNTWDQTSIVGITGTKAQFNTAVTDGDIFYVGDTLTESGLSLSDNTTNNASASKHGFLPKLDNTGTKYLRDDGTWQTVTSWAPKQFRITIPWEIVADTSNYQWLYFRNTSWASWTITNVYAAVGKAAAWTGAAAAFNLYKSSGTNSDGINTSATNLFTSAVDLGTWYTSSSTPNTTTVEDGRWLSLRVTSSAGATNKASDLQVIITLA